MRRMGLMMLALTTWLCLMTAAASARAEGVNRALLVGCDRFVTQEETTPASATNVTRVAEALSGGAMNLERLITRRNDLSSAAELESLIQAAFGDAAQGDVSYFYISTHGQWSQGMDNGEMALLLSDGNREEAVTARQLRAMFDRISGIKVLILDACHSGAVIGKGIHGPFGNVFAGEDYKVLCSSGGAEQSWFWQGEASVGAGYFSSALAAGLSVQGGYGADENRDGVITLTELKRYLLAYHGASTVRCYPEEDDFAVLRYDASAYTGRRRDSIIEGIAFAGDTLSADNPAVNFSFNVVRPAQVAYQIVYQKEGRWDFEHARLIYDNEERFGVHGDTRGYLSPGMKDRTLSLERADGEGYGYVLLQMVAKQENQWFLAASKVLCVPPAKGDPLLEILPEASFCPEQGDELNFVIHHQYPCELTVTMEDMDGKTVRRLCSRASSRPEQLLPRGSFFTWNGRRANGESAPEGQYRIRVKAYIGEDMYEMVSEPVLLLSPEG